MELTGAQILLESLRREGVEVVFGFPGGAVIDIYDQLPNYPLRHILARHEQGAIHAADGYARATGKVGVCLVTSGPGATNAVTGIATAYMDSVPVVVITGQVPTPLIGNDAFQEVDIVGITRSCTKHNYLVKDVRDLARVIKEAFYLAATGRPGPVLIDLPKDVQKAVTEYKYPKTIKMRSYNPTYAPNPKQVAKVADVVRKAKKPIIYAGGGVIASGASEELAWLARSFRIPVTATLMALGCFPANDPLWLGMLGMHGTYAANMAISQADLILAIGSRFDDRVTGKISEFAKNAKIVHIDIDPTSIQKNVPVHIPVVADCKKLPDGPAPDPRTRPRRSGDPRSPDMKPGTTASPPGRKEKTAHLYPGRGNDQAAVRGGGHFPPDQGRGHHHHRGGPEPDVGGPVLRVRQTAVVYQFRRARHHGVRFPGRHRRPDGLPGPARHRRGRRRLHPDVHPGAGHGRVLQSAGQDRHFEQWVSRHGPAVAGAFLQEELLRHLSRRGPGFRQAGRSLRRGPATGCPTRPRSKRSWPRRSPCPKPSLSTW